MKNRFGFIIVAGDGACPDDSSDHRTRRARCGLSYCARHSHNSAVQGPCRAGIRAAMRRVLWSWSKQIYFTDSQQTDDGLDTLLRGKPLRRGRHKDLWRRIKAALEAKGTENFRTLKIKTHQTAQQRAFESAEEMLCREKNERAMARKHEVKRAQDVHLMLTRIWINRYWRSRNGAEEYRDTNEDECMCRRSQKTC